MTNSDAKRSDGLALEVSNLVKKYGEFTALKGISFGMKEGEVFGLIGPNGAGKTTALRIISTILRITSGSVRMFGIDVGREPHEARKILSYLPEDAGAYKNLTGNEYLEFIARFFSDDTEDVRKITSKGVAIASLGDRMNDKVDTYSKGMARRLLVARALMIEPRVAILDELTSGLDVMNAQEIRRIVKDTSKRGTTVLLSSHNMLEVELMCDRIALINDGLIVEMGTPMELKERHNAGNVEEVFTRVIR
ncbi:MAG: ABC transporter ATP-binding protein [Methanobacteriota archaeon]|nr:MAG: ABC transporter ATP-binding protein [Euryarchaeota archaeon]